MQSVYTNTHTYICIDDLAYPDTNISIPRFSKNVRQKMGSERALRYLRGGNPETGESSGRRLESPTSSQEATIQGSSARRSKIKNPIKGKRESKKSPERLSYKRIGEHSAKQRRQREEGPQRLSVCGICIDRKTKAEMFKSNKCSHSYCIACVSQHVAAKISENILKVKCPDLACNAVLEPQDCRAVVSQQVVDRWEAALCEYALGSEKIYCPFKDCSAPLVDDGMQVVTTAECPHCHRLFCALCMVPWHAGYDCKNEGDKMDMKFMKLAEKEMWQKCPNCKFYVQRTHGCESITCRFSLLLISIIYNPSMYCLDSIPSPLFSIAS